MRKSLVFMSLFASVVATNALAADPTQCAHALLLDTESVDTRTSTRILKLQSVTESEFESARRNLSDGSSALIGGIPVTRSMNFEQFDQKRREFLSNYRFELNHADSLDWRKSHLSPSAAEAYAKCLQSLRPVGAHVWAIPPGRGEARFRIRGAFYTDQNDPTRRNATLAASGGTVTIPESTKARMRAFAGPREFTAWVQRQSSDAPVLISLDVTNSADGSADLTIPADPIVVKADEERTRHAIEIGLGASGKNQQAETTDCINAPFEVEFNPKTALIKKVRVSGENNGDHSGWVSQNDPSRVCGTVHVGADRSESGIGVGYELSVIGVRKSWRRLTSQE